MKVSNLCLVVVALALPACAGPLHAQPLVNNYGLGSIFHPIQEPPSIPLPPGCVGQNYVCCTDHVYVFGINGFNPLCTGNFNGLMRYIREHGFPHTYFEQLYSSRWYADEIRKIRHCDPQAKIALIGFSWGANAVRGLANHLNEEGIQIDLLIYLVGDLVGDTPESKPANVCRIVNIRAKGLVLLGGDLFFNGEDIAGAHNHMLTCRHILVPSRRETVELIMGELYTLACVPVGPPLPPPPALPAGAGR